MFAYAGTQVEPVTTDSEVQCKVTLIPTCSTPLCSPVKSIGCHSDDDNNDQDYIPSDLFSAEVMEEEEEEEKKKSKDWRKWKVQRGPLSVDFFPNYDLWLLFILLQDNLQYKRFCPSTEWEQVYCLFVLFGAIISVLSPVHRAYDSWSV